MTVAPPIVAATVILVRPADSGFEVFMVRRHIKSDFASDVYVFPGGKVEAQDGSYGGFLVLSKLPNSSASEPLCGWRSLYMAAIRELFEESGTLLAQTIAGEPLNVLTQSDADRIGGYRADIRAGILTLSMLAARESIAYAGDELVLFSNWITPQILSMRFDTFFFLARKPPHQEARHADLRELTDSLWIAPADALHRHHRDSFPLVYATLRHLEQLSAFDSIRSLFECAATRSLKPVSPRPIIKNGRQEFLIPGDAGYEEAFTQ